MPNPFTEFSCQTSGLDQLISDCKAHLEESSNWQTVTYPHAFNQVRPDTYWRDPANYKPIKNQNSAFLSSLIHSGNIYGISVNGNLKYIGQSRSKSLRSRLTAHLIFRKRINWKDHIEKQQKSGQSVPDYCRSHGLSQTYFMTVLSKQSEIFLLFPLARVELIEAGRWV